MDDNHKVRQSNFELMRIISMMMIVLCHVINTGHGNVIENCERESLKLIFEFLLFIIIVHVNSYVLLTGYFQCEQDFKMSKLSKTVNMVWFYRVSLMFLLIIIHVWHPNNIDIFRNIFPIDLGFYWYIDVYLILYCISPFLNNYIQKISKVSLRKTIFVLFLLFSVLPYFTGMKAFNNTGYSLYNFVLLYFIGSYLKKYPIRECYLFKNMTKNLFQLICIFLFFLCTVFNFVLTRFGNSIVSYSNIFSEIGKNLITVSTLYSNPFIIVQSIAYFCFFETLDFKNKFVNKVAPLALGVYVIHMNDGIKANLYYWLKIDNGPISSYTSIIYVLISVIFIYVVCSIIEWLRQKLFRFIAKRKICTRLREKCRSYIDGCFKNDTKINW